MVLSPLGFIGFNAILIAAAIGDVRSMRIPNLVPAALAVAAFLLAWPAGLGEFGSRLVSAALIGSVGLGLYVFGLLGGGDLKLLAAAGLWMPFSSLGAFVVLLGLAGGLQGVMTLASIRLAQMGSAGAPERAREMPYGVAIALAGALWSVSRTYGFSSG